MLAKPEINNKMSNLVEKKKMHDPFNVKSQSDSLYNPVINGKTSNAVIIVFNFYIKKKRQSLLYILLLSTKIPNRLFYDEVRFKNTYFESPSSKNH
jgi:hypothetical protein